VKRTGKPIPLAASPILGRLRVERSFIGVPLEPKTERWSEDKKQIRSEIDTQALARLPLRQVWDLLLLLRLCTVPRFPAQRNGPPTILQGNALHAPKGFMVFGSHVSHGKNGFSWLIVPC
jgi:hypothetical protein